MIAFSFNLQKLLQTGQTGLLALESSRITKQSWQ